MYLASETRYDTMPYNRLGTSGLKLSAGSLGLWHNFGNIDRFDNMQAMCFSAFDNGITRFDLANNYGPPKTPPSQRMNWHEAADLMVGG